MRYRIEIDEAACSGHGDCVAMAPEVFALEETAVVVGGGSDKEILAAAKACPALAITIIDGETGETVSP